MLDVFLNMFEQIDKCLLDKTGPYEGAGCGGNSELPPRPCLSSTNDSFNAIWG